MIFDRYQAQNGLDITRQLLRCLGGSRTTRFICAAHPAA